MIVEISKIGDFAAVLFDSTFMGRHGLKLGDSFHVTVVAETGVIVLMPTREGIDARTAAAAARRLIRNNPALFDRLS